MVIGSKLAACVIAVILAATNIAVGDPSLPGMYPRELQSFLLPDPVEWVLNDLIEIGTRWTHHRLIDRERAIKNSYLGSITVLDAVQDTDPYDFYLHYKLNRFLGVEVTREDIKATAVTHFDGHPDGTLVLDGPIVALVGRYSSDSSLTPFVSLGLFVANARVIHNPKWHYGFGGSNRDADYQAWLDAGSPPNPNGGYTRTLEPRSTLGFTLAAGCSTKLYGDALLAELFGRYHHVSSDVHYYLSRNGKIIDDRGIFRFPMNSLALGLGIKYSF